MTSGANQTPKSVHSTHAMDSMSQLRSRLQLYKQALGAFTSSSSAFKVLSTFPSKHPPRPKTIYVLDSSFNPPTRAHLHLALSALQKDEHEDVRFPKRLILLLAIQNADKAPKPAAFEERLVMMEIFARDLLAKLREDRESPEGAKETSEFGLERRRKEREISIDIALTTHPYFVDKAALISESPSYNSPNPSSPAPPIPQVHLVGYDTLVRIMDPKYYPPSHTLSALEPFLSEHRLRVTYRTDDSWAGKKEQDQYLKDVGEGKMDDMGAQRDWVNDGRIVLVDGRAEGGEVISSTKVRSAARAGDGKMLGPLVTEGVKDWILEEGLYTD